MVAIFTVYEHYCFLGTVSHSSIVSLIIMENHIKDVSTIELKSSHTYHIAGKFGGENVWRTYSFQAFGRKNLANE